MQFFLPRAGRRCSKAGIALTWLLSLTLAACGGGGSGDLSSGSWGGAANAKPGIVLTAIPSIKGPTFPDMAKTFGDAPFELSPPAGISGPATFSSSDSAVATISGSTVTIVGAGTATISALQGATGSNQQVTTARLTVKKAPSDLSLPTVTLKALSATMGAAIPLQASTRSTGAISYVLSNMVTASGQPGDVAVLGQSEGQTLIGTLSAGTGMITATQLPSANYEGGTVSANLVVEKQDTTISLNGLTQPYSSRLTIPVSFTNDVLTDEERVPSISLGNPAFGSVQWDPETSSIVVTPQIADSTNLSFSLPATANLAAATRTVSLTLTPVTNQQPGRQLSSVTGNWVYPEDYFFDPVTRAVTLKLCPTVSESIIFQFTDSAANQGAKHVYLGNVELSATPNGYSVPIPGVATGATPLKLRSIVDGAGLNGPVVLLGKEFDYDIHVVPYLPDQSDKCAATGGV